MTRTFFNLRGFELRGVYQFSLSTGVYQSFQCRYEKCGIERRIFSLQSNETTDFDERKKIRTRIRDIREKKRRKFLFAAEATGMKTTE